MASVDTLPLAALSEAEITAAAQLVRAAYEPGTKLRFKGISLLEPPKKALLAYWDGAGSASAPPRKAWVNYYLVGTSRFFEVVVNLTQDAVERHDEVPKGFHGSCDDEEIMLAEKITLADPRVQEEIRKLQLPEGAVVVCDPWIWGADGVDDDTRQYQCFMYMRDPSNSSLADSNHYAFPLAFSPVFSTVTMSVTRIEPLATGPASFATAASTQPYPWQAVPASEYVPEANALRTDLKALRVVQPDGASFALDRGRAAGLNELRWQKWAMTLTFNYREGVVLHRVRYDGRLLFHRVALSDMSIPYADPRPPFHKKQAFDLGDTGAGLTANDLQLGCDCLGAIAYLDGVLADAHGRPLHKRRAVCVHEQDAGLLWKHTNYRTGRAAVARRRELVVQTIITVSNYEYVLAFVFDQAGQMEYELRATGILSTQPIDVGASASPYGTVVHPGVLAAYHHHVLSLRVDPALDGDARNRLVRQDVCALPADPATNPFGNGYTATRTVVGTSGGYDLDTATNRTYLIENARKQNPVNGQNVAYKIHVPPVQPLLADPKSYHYQRADFGDHAIYVTKYQEHELYAGGQYTNQNKVTSGVRKWAARQDDIADEDIVVWVQFGVQHIPRIEDFPVMPVEIIKVAFKPVNFFTKNPAIDVPPSTQTFNKSVLVSDDVQVEGSEACCSQPRL